MEFKNKKGETPLDDLSGLKLDWINNRSQLNQAEAENIRKAVTTYLVGRMPKRSTLFTLPWLRELHIEMCGDVWKWAGVFRTTTNLLPQFSRPFQIQTDLQSMLDDLNCWKENKLPLIEQAAMLHHRAVKIHPFENVNGRWARLISDIWLRLHQGPVINWPIELHENDCSVRDDYIQALACADNMDYSLLFKFYALNAEG